MTLPELIDAADFVAIVRATGKDQVHWNNASNTKWESEANLAMIYNDQEVVVIDSIRGDAPTSLVIRNVGGTVGDTSFELTGLEPLVPGRDYLLFLEAVSTPTAEGEEESVSFVGLEQGIFVQSGLVYSNIYGLSVDPENLRPRDAK